MSYVPARLRDLVIQRAGGCCEYCRVSQEYSDVMFHIEHIIAVSHGGKTVENNLALSCLRCNLHKGTNIAAADPETDEPTFLFHPRRHHWLEHFKAELPFLSFVSTIKNELNSANNYFYSTITPALNQARVVRNLVNYPAFC